MRYRISIFLMSLLLLAAHNQLCYAQENVSINGKVQLYDQDGNLKEDQSGVVIFLDEVENIKKFQPSSKTVEIQQINKKFIPETLPIMVGTTVEFPNDDNVAHNVFSMSKTQPFDLGLYKKGATRGQRFDNLGLVKIYCNIHPQMVSNILVLPHPYFTVTEKDGSFVINDIPLGKANVRTWYPETTTHPEQYVVVKEGGVRDINLTVIEDLSFRITEETISIEHKNKWGQDYPSKY